MIVRYAILIFFAALVAVVVGTVIANVFSEAFGVVASGLEGLGQ